MISLTAFLTIYLLGGLTFIPLVLLTIFYVYISDPQLSLPQESSNKSNSKCIYPDEEYQDCDPDQGKIGWIRLTNQHDAAINSGRFMTAASNNNNNNNSTHGSSASSISSNNSNSGSSNSKKHKDLCYGVLKHGTLFVYESDKMFECKMIIPVHDFTVSIYPEDKRDPELFNKSTAIRLRPKHLRRKAKTNINNNNNNNHNHALNKAKTDTNLLDAKKEQQEEREKDDWTLDQDFYLYCGRAIDKEDWYFALISASNFMADSPTLNSKQFDMEAMQNLIKNIHHDPSSRQMQWMNAILGRIFLGMYKTDKVHKFFEQKITKKVSRMKRPMFIDAIAVHRVQVGHAIPYLNNPKLLSLSLDGSLTAEAQVDYEGGLCVEIETGFLWSYSSRMKPIRVNLILSVTLKKLSGRFMFKIKAPPTNRYWIGFYEPPVMDLVIKPIVSDKQIKLQVVTNAIESKIREVIAETMVLPNMDDFVFCDSEGKGGLFDDEVLSPPSTPPVEPPTPPSPAAAAAAVAVPSGRQQQPPASVKSEPAIHHENNNNNAKSSSSKLSSRRSSSASSPPAPRTSESMPPSVRRIDSAKSPEHLSVQPTEVSKSSPDLLSGRHSDSIAKEGGETASLVSQDSSDSSSSAPPSSIRWPTSMNLRRKKKGSDSASIMSEKNHDNDSSSSISHNDDDHTSSSAAPSVRSVGSSRRSFLSKLKSEISEEMRSGERKPLYQKAENIWQRSKEVTREYREQQADREQVLSEQQQQQRQQEQPKKEGSIHSIHNTDHHHHHHNGSTTSSAQEKQQQQQQQNSEEDGLQKEAEKQQAEVEENTRISKRPPPPPPPPPKPARPRQLSSASKEGDRPPLPPRVAAATAPPAVAQQQDRQQHTPSDSSSSSKEQEDDDDDDPPVYTENTTPTTTSKTPPAPPPRKPAAVAVPPLPPRASPRPGYNHEVASEQT